MDSDDSKKRYSNKGYLVQKFLLEVRPFQAMSETIVTKIDDVGSHIKEQEQGIDDLKIEMGGDGSQSPLASTKDKPEESA